MAGIVWELIRPGQELDEFVGAGRDRVDTSSFRPSDGEGGVPQVDGNVGAVHLETRNLPARGKKQVGTGKEAVYRSEPLIPGDLGEAAGGAGRDEEPGNPLKMRCAPG